jgi:hypothetical protein
MASGGGQLFPERLRRSEQRPGMKHGDARRGADGPDGVDEVA